MRREFWLALAVALGVLAHVATASALTCTLMPVVSGNETTPLARDLVAIHRASVDAIEGGGMTLIGPDDARRRIGRDPAGRCIRHNCAHLLLSAVDVDVVAFVRLFAPGGRLTTVVFTLISSEGSFAGYATVGTDLEGATHAAFRQARDRLFEGDLLLAGRSPPQPVPTSLPPAVPATPRPRFEEHAHWSNWVIGGSLVLGGVIAIVVPIPELLMGERCVSTSPAGCHAWITPNPDSYGAIAIGGAAAAAGIISLLSAPIRVQVRVTPPVRETAAVRVEVSGTY